MQTSELWTSFPALQFFLCLVKKIFVNESTESMILFVNIDNATACFFFLSRASCVIQRQKSILYSRVKIQEWFTFLFANSGKLPSLCSKLLSSVCDEYFVTTFTMKIDVSFVKEDSLLFFTVRIIRILCENTEWMISFTGIEEAE